MAYDVSLSLSPREAANPEGIHRALALTIGRCVAEDRAVVVRRSVDARKRPVRVNLGIRIYADGETQTPEPSSPTGMCGPRRRWWSWVPGRRACLPRCAWWNWASNPW